MKKIMSLLLVLVSTQVYSQSPWVKEKGKGYAQVSYNVITEYSSLYLSSGESLQLPRSVIDRSIQLYGEYGIGNDWQLSAALPYKLLTTGDVSAGFTTDAVSIQKGSFSALGNIELAIKKNFINKSYLLSGQVKAELPTSSLDESTGLRSGVDALSIVPSLTIGKGWNKMYGYFSIGSSVRSNDYSGDLRIYSEFGTKPIGNLWVTFVLDIVNSFENATPDTPSNQTEAGLYLNNLEYFAYGLKFAYEIKDDWGMSLAGYGGSSGNLVAKAPSINFGVYYKW